MASDLNESILIKVAHSPDPDDAFMFYALAKNCLETGKYRFTHKLVDIETLNQMAHTGFYELTALSLPVRREYGRQLRADDRRERKLHKSGAPPENDRGPRHDDDRVSGRRNVHGRPF